MELVNFVIVSNLEEAIICLGHRRLDFRLENPCQAFYYGSS